MTRSELLKSIATCIADYRKDEIEPRTPAHVDAWVKQFPPDVQLPILAETDHVLSELYFPRKAVEAFLGNLVSNPKLCGANPKQFWKSSRILQIQSGGESQAAMLGLLDEALQSAHGLSVAECKTPDGPCVYLDDVIFSGNRCHNDFRDWVATAPPKVKVHIVCMAFHTGGQYFAKRAIERDFREAGKTIETTWWRGAELESRFAYRNTSDVLWPASLPSHPLVAQYVKRLGDAGHPPQLRTAGQPSAAKVFTDEAARNLLEQQFLVKGLDIMAKSHMPPSARPLGWMKLDTLGCGALVVTHRNCANSCPLVFWADGCWTPLFPRKTNAPSAALRAFQVEADF